MFVAELSLSSILNLEFFKILVNYVKKLLRQEANEKTGREPLTLNSCQCLKSGTSKSLAAADPCILHSYNLRT